MVIPYQTLCQIATIIQNTTILQKLNLTLNETIEFQRMLQNITFGITNTTESGEKCECDVYLINQYAEHYHGYFSIIVCLFGSVANILNIAVLTRKEMFSAPINKILTGLAIADMLVMFEYVPFAYYYHIVLPGVQDFPYFGAVFMLFHMHFSQVLHTVSICLTLALAVWRYLSIGYPQKNHILCTDSRCRTAIILSYVLPVILCSPTFFLFKITSDEINENNELFTLYFTDLSDFARDNSFYVINFWIYAVVIKLLPCCILTVISCWLIRTLFKAKKRKQILRGYDLCTIVVNEKDPKRLKNKAERRADRTTRMLVAVLLLFLISEFPQGIFALRIGMKGECFFVKCYQSFGELMDIMALLNGAINFILYCCMNRMFRVTVLQLFKHKLLSKRVLATPSDTHTTYV